MQTSWNGIKFICCREALVLVAYHDGDNEITSQDGIKILTPRWSYGFGNQTHENGTPVKEGDTITIEDAFARVRAHVVANDKVLNNLISVPLEQHQWDAVASLAYQARMDATRDVCNAFNNLPPELAALTMARWPYGKAGLAKRRAREINMAIFANYGDISHYKLYRGDPKLVLPELTIFPDV